MAEQFANSAVTTLNGNITAGSLSLTVTSASLFPAVGTFRILIGSELIKVTAVAGSVFTVVRGDDGSTAASHLTGATVTAVQTAGSIAQLKQDISIISGITVSGTPAAGAVLRATSASAGAWGTVDMADTDAVTGVLPAANQAAQTLGGDATGTTAAVQVDIARGLKSATTTVSVSAATAPTAGQVLTATAGNDATWQSPSSGSPSVGAAQAIQGSDGAAAFVDTGWLASATYLKAPGTVPATGLIRLPSGATINSVVGGVDRPFVELNAGSDIILGASSGTGSIINRATSTIYNQVASINLATMSSASIDVGVPIIGNAGGTSPYGVHGGVVSSMVDADYVVPAAEYIYSEVDVSNATTLGADRKIKFPTPATEAASYTKEIINNTTGGFGLFIHRADGAGIAYFLANAKRTVVRFRPAGVYQCSADV